MLAIFGVIFHLICYKGVKERHVIERPKKKGVNKKAFFNLVKNEAFAVLAIFTLLTIMSMFLVQSTQLYYFKYVLDKPNLVGLVSTLNFIVLLPALFATTYISKS